MTCPEGCCPAVVYDWFCGAGGAAEGLHQAWRELKRIGGEDWKSAMSADAEVVRRFGRYVHRKGLPLADAVDIPEDHGYVQTGFDPEGRCDEGVCWV